MRNLESKWTKVVSFHKRKVIFPLCCLMTFMLFTQVE